MPTVSVIVPNYNHARYLNQRIDSILEQTYQDFELIILDDCSTDNSREVIETYRNNPHVSHIVYNETNGGSPFAQWNKGIELACGEWIWIAESDDWADNSFLETMIASLVSHPYCGIAYSRIHYMRDGKVAWKNKCDGQIYEYGGKEFILSKLLLGNEIVNVSAVIFDRKLFNKINHNLYSSMHLCGDWLFYTLVCEHTNVLLVNRQLSYYRMHKSNTSSEAEHNGLSFIEGIKVLDYIKNRYPISWRKYSKDWGKMLAKYQKQFDIQRSIIIRIKHLFKLRHFPVIVYYDLYRIKYKLF